MTNQNLKLFNLERALAGEPVVTREGHKVIEMHYYKKRDKFPLLALIQIKDGQKLLAYNDEGIFCWAEEDGRHSNDLLMAPVTKKYYVIFYKECGVIKTEITDNVTYFNAVNVSGEFKRMEIEVEVEK